MFKTSQLPSFQNFVLHTSLLLINYHRSLYW